MVDERFEVVDRQENILVISGLMISELQRLPHWFRYPTGNVKREP